MKTLLVLEGGNHDTRQLRGLLAEQGYRVSALRECCWPLENESQLLSRDAGTLLVPRPVGSFRSSLDGKLLGINRAGAEIHGYGTPEQMMEEVNRVGLAKALYARPERRQELVDEVLESEDWQLYEERFRRRDGTLVHCLFHLRAVRDGDGRPVELEGFIEDISARKAVERALQFTQFTIDNTNDQAFWMTEDHCFFYVNEAACRSLGYSREELMGISLYDIDPDATKKLLSDDWRRLREQGSSILERRHRAKDGRIYPVEIRANLVVFEGREYNCAFATDISERKKTEEQVRASLLEKEVLLREIHHRVKNNLQVVSSLLYLQSQKLADPELKNHFLESQSRICSMALAHEQLYQSKNLSEVSLKSYVESLVSQLRQVFQMAGQQIDCRTEIDAVALDIAKVIPCGLLITELLSNAYRHAFADGRNGAIRIAIEERENKLLLTVADDGIGLPAGFDYRQTATLGMQLVRALCNQLNGVIEVENQRGTLFRVTFSP